MLVADFEDCAVSIAFEEYEALATFPAKSKSVASSQTSPVP